MLETTTTPASAEGLTWLPGGTFSMGSEDFYAEERPVRPVQVGGFWIEPHAVTVEAFRRFADATGYVTLAERTPSRADYPNVDPALVVPGSLVFQRPRAPVELDDHRAWWTYVPDASWWQPEGPGSDVGTRSQHPVTHMAYADAAAYAAWAGRSLPTEAEWEYAARGGLEGAHYAWGDHAFPGGRAMANTWQGEFPVQNLRIDGYDGTSPWPAFPPNGFGLYDMTGNVWEWTCDPFTGDQSNGDGFPRHVVKGGSHLSAPNYSLRYRPAARRAETIDTATADLGFRCVVRPDPR